MGNVQGFVTGLVSSLRWSCFGGTLIMRSLKVNTGYKYACNVGMGQWVSQGELLLAANNRKAAATDRFSV